MQANSQKETFSRKKQVYLQQINAEQIHLCYTSLVSVKSNQFDFDEVQPMPLHPGDINLQQYLPEKERKRETKLTT